MKNLKNPKSIAHSAHNVLLVENYEGWMLGYNFLSGCSIVAKIADWGDYMWFCSVVHAILVYFEDVICTFRPISTVGR